MRKIFLIAAIALGAAVVFACRFVLLAVASVLYVYLLPGVVAQKRSHPRERDIFVATALTGWLIVPWVAALWYAAKGSHATLPYADLPLASGVADD